MKTQKILLFILGVMSTLLFACSDNKDSKGGVAAYDPNKDVTISGFMPDSGGIAEKFVLMGTNFGDDPSNIKLFFNEKQATIISSKGERLYALAPRLPGEFCDIRLEVGDQKVVADKQFHYLARMTVSTVAGSRTTGNTKFAPGSLTEARFADLRSVVADSYGNIFVSQYGGGDVAGVAKIDVPNNYVSWAADIAMGSVAWNTPTIDKKTDIIYYPGNTTGVVLELNPGDLWTPRVRRLKAPVDENGKEQWTGPSWWYNMHSLAMGHDGYLYSRIREGRIAKIDPKTWIGTFFMKDTSNGIIDDYLLSDSYVAINPKEPDWLYIAYEIKHSIRRFHLKEHYFELFAGAGGGSGGWRDGVGTNALFKSPKAICFDEEGILYVADTGNSCIRSVSPDRVVSTVAGIPGESGAVNGAPFEAKFQIPWGICTDKEGNIYVAEGNPNRMVRKITLE